MPPRWPRGRTSRRRWRADATTSRSTSQKTSTSSARHVEAVREERAVAGVRLLLLADPAHGQEHVVGVAREQVAAARAAVSRAGRRRRVPPLDLGAVVGVRADHQLPRSFSTQRKAGMFSFEPSRMPAWLAPVCEERSVSHSTRRCVSVGEPARHLGRVAVAHRPLEHRLREPVDLEVEDPGDVGRPAVARPARDAGARRGASTRRRRSCPTITCRTVVTAEIDERRRGAPTRSRRPRGRPSMRVRRPGGRARPRRGRAGRRGATVYGRRSAAITGGTIALTTAMRSADERARPRSRRRRTPGRIAAATMIASAPTTSPSRRCQGLSRGRMSARAGRWP